MYQIKRIVVVALLLSTFKISNAQSSISKNGESLPITTSVPFLRITPDARHGGMGDAGLATSPDASAIFHNPAKLAFCDEPYGVSLSYVPWLRSLVNDIYLAHAAGYGKFGKNMNQAFGGSVRYFSLGQIDFTNVVGDPLGSFKPNEFAVDAAYSRILAKGFSTAIGMRFIYSNLAGGQTLNGVLIKPGIAASADISFYYNKDISLGKMKSNLGLGLNLSNLGSKITYTDSRERDFIPMNMGIGARYSIDIDQYNQFAFCVDFNKLLVPTPNLDTSSSNYDTDNNGIPDYREKSVPSAIFSSFGDAPGGFREELQEFTVGAGVEYWYDKLFAVRAGYFYENPNKGRRQFLSLGVGLRYSVFGIDFAYLVPTTSQRNPLDNTLRFTLLFNFSKAKEKQEAVPTNEPPMSN